ncbi:MAG: hypothetical protein ACEQSR_05280 [Candidatus Methylacidiphilales bacterium]
MNKLIKLGLALVLTLGMSQLFAQKGADEKAKMMVTKLTEKLTLTADQQQKATVIFTEHFNNMVGLRAELKKANSEQARTAIKEQRKKTDNSFTSILTDDQKVRYQAAKKEMRQSMKNKKEGKGRGGKGKGNKNAPAMDPEMENHLDDEAF